MLLCVCSSCFTDHDRQIVRFPPHPSRASDVVALPRIVWARATCLATNLPVCRSRKKATADEVETRPQRIVDGKARPCRPRPVARPLPSSCLRHDATFPGGDGCFGGCLRQHLIRRYGRCVLFSSVDETHVDDVFQTFPCIFIRILFSYKNSNLFYKSPVDPTVRAFLCVEELWKTCG